MRNTFNLESQLENQHYDQIQQIEDIDENGYLVNHSGSELESEEKDDVDLDSDFQKERPQIDYNSSSEFETENQDDVNMDHKYDKRDIDVNVMGQVFDTPEDAYTFYNRYAFIHGFGIRVRSSFKNKITNEVYKKLYVCNKERFKCLKANSSTKKRRRVLRTGCEAVFQISKNKDGKWFVDAFSDTHNHELSTPSKVMKHCSHAKTHRTLACKSLMLDLSQSRLRSCQIKKVVNTMKDPCAHDVTSKQCADIISEERKKYKGKEFYGVIKYFQDKASVDSKHYWVVDLFDDGSRRNIFWANGRSRDAYVNFGDVVVFDVTYMTNRFRMPFAPFVGVNHHGQSILFGGALLENEKEETFVWLFEQFVKCMFDTHPVAIITDQDKAVCNAIKRVFPNTRHRYCAWHMKKHELEHLQPLKERYSDFQDMYKQWVKSVTVEEFETQWKAICSKYDLESNCWLKELYKQRSRWGKVFLKDCFFFAGMTTSGRSESIHSFFDGYVTSETMLNEFVVQYDKAVKSRRAAEEDEDFRTMNSKAVLSSVNPIEEKAGTRYTRMMFDVFQKEWIQATNNLTHETVCKSLEEIKYKKKHVEILPDRYILPRWTLDARYRMDNYNIRLEDINSDKGVSPSTLWCVQAKYTKVIEHAKDSASDIKKLDTFFGKFLEDLLIREKSKQNENPSQGPNVGSSHVHMVPQISVRDPQVPFVTKGRPKKPTRIKSFLEAPKKRTCSYLKGLGHYINGCSKKKADDAAAAASDAASV